MRIGYPFAPNPHLRGLRCGVALSSFLNFRLAIHVEVEVEHRAPADVARARQLEAELAKNADRGLFFDARIKNDLEIIALAAEGDRPFHEFRADAAPPHRGMHAQAAN